MERCEDLSNNQLKSQTASYQYDVDSAEGSFKCYMSAGVTNF
jgi:hypothetical protein